MLCRFKFNSTAVIPKRQASTFFHEPHSWDHPLTLRPYGTLRTPHKHHLNEATLLNLISPPTESTSQRTKSRKHAQGSEEIMHLVRRHAPILNQPQPLTPQAIPRRQAAPFQAQHLIQAMIPLPSSRPSQAATQYQGKPSQAKQRPAKIAASLPAFSPPAPSPRDDPQGTHPCL